MLSDKEIICPDNLLNVAHKKKGVKAGIVNAGKPLPMQSVQDAVKENLIEHFSLKKNNIPLKSLDILDIGCGGGLLSEPISRMGANVTGIDASKNNINIAKHHLKKSKLKRNLKKGIF